MRRTIYIVIELVFLSCLYLFGGDISIDKQLIIFDKLITISAIVFGIMGAWLAIVYSESLNKIFSNDFKIKDRKEALEEIDFLLKPMGVSALIIVIALLFFIFEPILSQSSFLHSHLSVVRSVSYTIVGCLTILQIWCFIYAFAPAEKLKRKGSKKIRKSEIDQTMKSGVQKVKKEDLES